MAGMTWGRPEKKPDSALIHAKGQVTSATNNGRNDMGKAVRGW